MQEWTFPGMGKTGMRLAEGKASKIMGSAIGELSVILICIGIIADSTGLVVSGVLIMAGLFARRYVIRRAQEGFTLIEMSIVLVIIGLVVGGVLVGLDLIRAAEVRATISQIEKFNSATNTFRGKFGFLPGDINAAAAATFGFAARGAYPGQGDGNGILEGNNGNSAVAHFSNSQGAGETAMFWVDLSSAAAGNLIEGGFNTAIPVGGLNASISGTTLNLYFPQAKLGRGNYFYVYSGGWILNAELSPGDGTNYYGLSALTSVNTNTQPFSSTTLSVRQAYDIDKKIDDGYPQSGNIMATYLNTGAGVFWAGSGGVSGAPYTTATPASVTTCFDNGNTTGATQQYSLGQSNGSYANCALSFKFQ